MSLAEYLPRRENGPTRNIIEGAVIGFILTGLSYIVALHFGWVSGLDPVEVFAVFTSYMSTYLCVVERRANYPIGAISNAAYCVLFASFGLVGSSIVTGYLTFSLLYGWFRWKSDEETRPITNLELKWLPAYLAVAAVAFVGALYLYPLFGQPVVWTDAVILVASVIAQLLLDNKKIETWGVWIVVNVFAIYTYGTAGIALAAFQYVFFLLNAFYGYYVWRQARKEATPVQAAVGHSTGPHLHFEPAIRN